MPLDQRPITLFFAKGDYKAQTNERVTPGNKNEKRKYLKEFNKKDSCDASKQWERYLFIATNNFTEYSVVNLLARPNYQLKKVIPVGFEVATATVDDNSALTHISVKEPFRRQKIGAQLIRFIKHCCPKFIVFGGTEHNSRYRLTQEGAALMEYCVSNKILSPTQVIVGNVPESPQKPERLTYKNI